MVNGIWGRKIGMTQLFSEQNKVVPVTVIDIDNWFVTQIKTQAQDGYDAVQLGSVRDKYVGHDFSHDWLKNKKQYFQAIREVSREDLAQDVVVGQSIDVAALVEPGQFVDVFGTTKGRGFQGVVKRHGFTGGNASHGPRMGRRTGSIGFMRSQGRVVKGKKMPGHMGNVQRVMRNLEVIKVDTESKVIVVKGSVPGCSGSTVFMRKV